MSLSISKDSRLGYACLNITLSKTNPAIVCNKGMRKSTFQQKGLAYVSELALRNLQALYAIVQWNYEHGITFFRMSSDVFPWMSEYAFEDLPNFEALTKQLQAIGKFAQRVGQRLTFHPGQYNVLGSQSSRVVQNTIHDLNQHARIMDSMGLPCSPYSKINIHLGTAQGGKDAAIKRFCTNFSYLSDSAQKRLTVENDDKTAMFTVEDLAEGVTAAIGVPVVCDMHHHFIHHTHSLQSSLRCAVETWPQGIVPVVHVSEPKIWYDTTPGLRIQAHADYVQNHIVTYGHQVDVMLEAKAKELAVLAYKKQYPGQFV